jgi:uncharacterized RDD family membrane protein YckC
MKCPKCGYLGFEDVERCRNCGYDFSLTPDAPLPELPLRDDSRLHRSGKQDDLDDLSLVDPAIARSRSARGPVASADPPSAPTPEVDRVFIASSASRSSGAGRELPLFGSAAADDEPLIKRASPPRAPLAVRRATPEVPRVRAEQPRVQSFDLAPDLDSAPVGLVRTPSGPVADRPAADRSTAATTEAQRTAAARATLVNTAASGRTRLDAVASDRPEPLAVPDDSASIPRRLLAVLIDLVILAAVDVVVVYLTMKICGISSDELGMLPIGPLLAFILVQNGGYLVAFTAGGQTLGKMAAGIRVVSEESDGTVDFGRAMTRTIIWMILAIPAGAGFLTLFNQDRRGLHDRFAGTRVIRASA